MWHLKNWPKKLVMCILCGLMNENVNLKIINNLSKVVNDNNSLSFSTFQPAQATIEQNQQQLQNTSVQVAKNVADSMLGNSKPRLWS